MAHEPRVVLHAIANEPRFVPNCFEMWGPKFFGGHTLLSERKVQYFPNLFIFLGDFEFYVCLYFVYCGLTCSLPGQLDTKAAPYLFGTP
jgi:hypothetical protein